MVQVLLESAERRVVERHQTRLLKLRVANDQPFSAEIPDLQGEGLGDTEPGRHQQAEQRHIGVGRQRVEGTKLSGTPEQPVDLRVGVQPWWSSCLPVSEVSRGRHLVPGIVKLKLDGEVA